MLSQIDFQGLQNYLMWAVRIVLVVGAGVIGWFVGPPLVIVLHRLAYHKPAPAWVRGWSRLGGAFVLGLLAFLIPLALGGGLGGGGWGWGTGSGLGGGGNGGGSGKGQNGGQASNSKGKPGNGSGDKKGTETLSVEMVVSKEYAGGGKYYLIQRKGPPKTLDEVRAVLQRNKHTIGRVEIIIYANSVSREHPAVQRLQQTAEELQLEVTVPPEYLAKVKTTAPDC